MQYAVEVVGDDELPAGVNMVIVEREAGPPIALLSGPVARAWRTVRAWEDTQEPCTAPTILLPAPSLMRAI